MNLIKPSWQIESRLERDTILSNLERYGRTCYKSEDKITDKSASKFCRMILTRNHLSVIEHESMTVRFICDRGVTHELVRHRLASFSQESTRYCNYSGGVMFVIPPWVDMQPGEYYTIPVGLSPLASREWFHAVHQSESSYQRLLHEGWSPQQARSVLPNSLKTEIVVTANLREWGHIFRMRCDKSAHPQMQELMIPLRDHVSNILPELFPLE